MVLPTDWDHEVSPVHDDLDMNYSSRRSSVFFVVCMLRYFSKSKEQSTNLTGDVADDRFFHKTNDSDATQFALLFPRIGAHGIYQHPSHKIATNLSLECGRYSGYSSNSSF